MTSTERLHFRVRPETEQRLRFAAQAAHQSLTEFVITAAEQRADEVLASASVVPADYFDSLLAALDESPRPNAAIRRVARGPRASVHR
jgi:uncharacterized protein (DUF1778 family)